MTNILLLLAFLHLTVMSDLNDIGVDDNDGDMPHDDDIDFGSDDNDNDQSVATAVDDDAGVFLLSACGTLPFDVYNAMCNDLVGGENKELVEAICAISIKSGENRNQLTAKMSGLSVFSHLLTASDVDVTRIRTKWLSLSNQAADSIAMRLAQHQLDAMYRVDEMTETQTQMRYRTKRTQQSRNESYGFLSLQKLIEESHPKQKNTAVATLSLRIKELRLCYRNLIAKLRDLFDDALNCCKMRRNEEAVAAEAAPAESTLATAAGQRVAEVRV